MFREILLKNYQIFDIKEKDKKGKATSLKVNVTAIIVEHFYREYSLPIIDIAEIIGKNRTTVYHYLKIAKDLRERNRNIYERLKSKIVF